MNTPLPYDSYFFSKENIVNEMYCKASNNMKKANSRSGPQTPEKKGYKRQQSKGNSTYPNTRTYRG